MFSEQINLSIKAGLLIGSWIFAQVQPLTDTGLLDKAFDQMFSIGLLLVLLIFMVLENKRKDKKHDSNQEAYVDLLTQNTEAIKDFNSTNKDIAKSVERSNEATNKAIEHLTRAFEKLEQKL